MKKRFCLKGGTNSNKKGTVYGKSGAQIMKQESVAENKKRIESRRSLNAENKGNSKVTHQVYV